MATRPHPMSTLRLLLVAGLAALAACGSPSQPDGTPPPGGREPTLLPVSAIGTAGTLDLGSWNLEWFGDPGNGPEDEDRQLVNAAHVLAGLDVDLWSVQEVVRADRFQALVDSLPGYGGLLADDPAVVGGREAYGGFGGNEMKVGLLYRASMARVEAARVILAEHDHAFAGRPPVEVRLALEVDGRQEKLVVVLLHAKAGADPEDRARREAGAEALKEYLDTTWPDARVAVLGDFNDDVDVSIDAGAPSPYRAFVDDPDDYRFLSAALSRAGTPSTVFYPDVIDHHLATDELVADYVDGSVTAVPADQWVPGYGETTSDHYPVVTRYRPGG